MTVLLVKIENVSMKLVKLLVTSRRKKSTNQTIRPGHSRNKSLTKTSKKIAKETVNGTFGKDNINPIFNKNKLQTSTIPTLTLCQGKSIFLTFTGFLPFLQGQILNIFSPLTQTQRCEKCS